MTCLVTIVRPFRGNGAVVPTMVTQEANLCYLTIWTAMSTFESKHTFISLEREIPEHSFFTDHTDILFFL